MPNKKLNGKPKTNGKLPTAKDIEKMKMKLTERDKARIASTRAVLLELMKEEELMKENEKTSV